MDTPTKALEKLIRQEARWQRTASTWRRRAAQDPAYGEEWFGKAEVLTRCCMDMNYITDQFARRLTPEQRAEAYQTAAARINEDALKNSNTYDAPGL